MISCDGFRHNVGLVKLVVHESISRLSVVRDILTETVGVDQGKGRREDQQVQKQRSMRDKNSSHIQGKGKAHDGRVTQAIRVRTVVFDTLYAF